jgi:predicted CopG family antitoxin
MIDMGETTTIPLSKETRDLLKKFGQKGETYDELIRRLLESAEQMEFAKRQKRILSEEEFVPLEEV